MNIRPFELDDWPAVEAIYTAGIATGQATFELEPPALEQFVASHTPELASTTAAGATYSPSNGAAPSSASTEFTDRSLANTLHINEYPCRWPLI